MSELQHYIDPPSERKDIPEHPITKLWKAWTAQLRKRDTILIVDTHDVNIVEHEGKVEPLPGVNKEE